MKIQLEGNIYLTSDRYCYKISELKTKKNKTTGEDEEYFDPITSHTKVEQALRSFRNSKIRKSSVTTIDGLIKKVEESERWLENFFKKHKVDLK